VAFDLLRDALSAIFGLSELKGSKRGWIPESEPNLDQRELNKTIVDVAKDVKRPKLEDKDPGGSSKCIHCGNIWNKALISSSKSGLSESNGGKSNTGAKERPKREAAG
ncbi:hypothetical protein Tco_0305073, partial [Tanacetum coccineum]